MPLIVSAASRRFHIKNQFARMKMGKNSNAVGHIKPDRVICLFGRSPPVCRVRYTSGSPPRFSPQRNQWLSLRRSRSPCRGRLRHPGWYSILLPKAPRFQIWGCFYISLSQWSCGHSCGAVQLTPSASSAAVFAPPAVSTQINQADCSLHITSTSF